jgi:hypothetical protein
MSQIWNTAEKLAKSYKCPLRIACQKVASKPSLALIPDDFFLKKKLVSVVIDVLRPSLIH